MIITLCGSARFEQEFKDWNLRLTMAGHTVFSLVQYPSDNQGNKDWYTPEQKAELDRAHFRKIDASEAILVICPGGYIGDSTRNEFMHAYTTGRDIILTHPIDRADLPRHGVSVISDDHYLLATTTADD